MFKSRVDKLLLLLTKMPRLLPPPSEYILIVEPFRELNEKFAGPKVPVPSASTPYTLLAPSKGALLLSTVKTHERTLDVTEDSPVSRIPFRVWCSLDSRRNVRSSTRLFPFKVRSVVSVPTLAI